MSLRKSALHVALAVAASLSLAGVSRAQDAKALKKVGTELARLNEPGGLYGYLKTDHPAFFEIADAVDLAGVLDGTVTAAAFDAAFKAKLDASSLSADEKTSVLAEAKAFKKVLKSLDAERSSPRDGLTAAEVKKGDVVKTLKDHLFDAHRSWMTQLWDDTKAKSVAVEFVPGKLVWFNPNVSIPELGIRAGVPLTDEQKAAIAELFSFKTVPAATNPAHSAAFPAYVGRAVNPNSHVLTILNEKGEVLSDLVAKGGGPNVTTTTRDGRLDYSEALMDSELSRNLGRAGVKNYDALAVVVPDGLAGKAITIRAPRSLLRHMDMDKLNDEELKKTLERVTKEVAIREGLPSLSIGEWLKTYLPRTSGENWGILKGLGVQHGSDYTRDNHGLAETVDWGWARLNDGSFTDQAQGEWRNIEQTINRVNQILPDAEKVVASDAKAIFDAAYQTGIEKGKAEVVRFDEKILNEMVTNDLRTLAGGTKDPSNTGTLSYNATSADAIARMKASGHTVELFDYSRLVGLPLDQLRTLAQHNGITIPAGTNDRAAVIAALTGKQAAEVRGDLVAETPATVAETSGFSSRLRDLLTADVHAAVDPAADGR